MDFIVFKARETWVYSVYFGHPPHNTSPWAQIHSHKHSSHTTITRGTYSDILQDWQHITKCPTHATIESLRSAFMENVGVINHHITLSYGNIQGELLSFHMAGTTLHHKHIPVSYFAVRRFPFNVF